MGHEPAPALGHLDVVRVAGSHVASVQAAHFVFAAWDGHAANAVAGASSSRRSTIARVGDRSCDWCVHGPSQIMLEFELELELEMIE